MLKHCSLHPAVIYLFIVLFTEVTHGNPIRREKPPDTVEPSHPPEGYNYGTSWLRADGDDIGSINSNNRTPLLDEDNGYSGPRDKYNKTGNVEMGNFVGYGNKQIYLNLSLVKGKDGVNSTATSPTSFRKEDAVNSSEVGHSTADINFDRFGNVRSEYFPHKGSKSNYLNSSSSNRKDLKLTEQHEYRELNVTSKNTTSNDKQLDDVTTTEKFDVNTNSFLSDGTTLSRSVKIEYFPNSGAKTIYLNPYFSNNSTRQQKYQEVSNDNIPVMTSLDEIHKLKSEFSHDQRTFSDKPAAKNMEKRQLHLEKVDDNSAPLYVNLLDDEVAPLSTVINRQSDTTDFTSLKRATVSYMNAEPSNSLLRADNGKIDPTESYSRLTVANTKPSGSGALYSTEATKMQTKTEGTSGRRNWNSVDRSNLWTGEGHDGVTASIFSKLATVLDGRTMWAEERHGGTVRLPFLKSTLRNKINLWTGEGHDGATASISSKLATVHDRRTMWTGEGHDGATVRKNTLRNRVSMWTGEGHDGATASISSDVTIARAETERDRATGNIISNINTTPTVKMTSLGSQHTTIKTLESLSTNKYNDSVYQSSIISLTKAFTASFVPSSFLASAEMTDGVIKPVTSDTAASNSMEVTNIGPGRQEEVTKITTAETENITIDELGTARMFTPLAEMPPVITNFTESRRDESGATSSGIIEDVGVVDPSRVSNLSIAGSFKTEVPLISVQQNNESTVDRTKNTPELCACKKTSVKSSSKDFLEELNTTPSNVFIPSYIPTEVLTKNILTSQVTELHSAEISKVISGASYASQEQGDTTTSSPCTCSLTTVTVSTILNISVDAVNLDTVPTSDSNDLTRSSISTTDQLSKQTVSEIIDSFSTSSVELNVMNSNKTTLEETSNLNNVVSLPNLSTDVNTWSEKNVTVFDEQTDYEALETYSVTDKTTELPILDSTTLNTRLVSLQSQSDVTTEILKKQSNLSTHYWTTLSSLMNDSDIINNSVVTVTEFFSKSIDSETEIPFQLQETSKIETSARSTTIYPLELKEISDESEETSSPDSSFSGINTKIPLEHVIVNSTETTYGISATSFEKSLEEYHKSSKVLTTGKISYKTSENVTELTPELVVTESSFINTGNFGVTTVTSAASDLSKDMISTSDTKTMKISHSEEDYSLYSVARTTLASYVEVSEKETNAASLPSPSNNFTPSLFTANLMSDVPLPTNITDFYVGNVPQYKLPSTHSPSTSANVEFRIGDFLSEVPLPTNVTENNMGNVPYPKQFSVPSSTTDISLELPVTDMLSEVSLPTSVTGNATSYKTLSVPSPSISISLELPVTDVSNEVPLPTSVTESNIENVNSRKTLSVPSSSTSISLELSATDVSSEVPLSSRVTEFHIGEGPYYKTLSVPSPSTNISLELPITDILSEVSHPINVTESFEGGMSYDKTLSVPSPSTNLTLEFPVTNVLSELSHPTNVTESYMSEESQYKTLSVPSTSTNVSLELPVTDIFSDVSHPTSVTKSYMSEVSHHETLSVPSPSTNINLELPATDSFNEVSHSISVTESYTGEVSYDKTSVTESYLGEVLQHKTLSLSSISANRSNELPVIYISSEVSHTTSVTDSYMEKVPYHKTPGVRSDSMNMSIELPVTDILSEVLHPSSVTASYIEKVPYNKTFSVPPSSTNISHELGITDILSEIPLPTSVTESKMENFPSHMTPSVLSPATNIILELPVTDNLNEVSHPTSVTASDIGEMPDHKTVSVPSPSTNISIELFVTDILNDVSHSASVTKSYMGEPPYDKTLSATSFSTNRSLELPITDILSEVTLTTNATKPSPSINANVEFRTSDIFTEVPQSTNVTDFYTGTLRYHTRKPVPPHLTNATFGFRIPDFLSVSTHSTKVPESSMENVSYHKPVSVSSPSTNTKSGFHIPDFLTMVTRSTKVPESYKGNVSYHKPVSVSSPSTKANFGFPIPDFLSMVTHLSNVTESYRGNVSYHKPVTLPSPSTNENVRFRIPDFLNEVSRTKNGTQSFMWTVPYRKTYVPSSSSTRSPASAVTDTLSEVPLPGNVTEPYRGYRPYHKTLSNPFNRLTHNYSTADFLRVFTHSTNVTESLLGNIPSNDSSSKFSTTTEMRNSFSNASTRTYMTVTTNLPEFYLRNVIHEPVTVPSSSTAPEVAVPESPDASKLTTVKNHTNFHYTYSRTPPDVARKKPPPTPIFSTATTIRRTTRLPPILPTSTIPSRTTEHNMAMKNFLMTKTTKPPKTMKTSPSVTSEKTIWKNMVTVTANITVSQPVTQKPLWTDMISRDLNESTSRIPFTRPRSTEDYDGGSLSVDEICQRRGNLLVGIDCKRYLHCYLKNDRYHIEEKTCGKGLNFSIKQNKCVAGENVDCPKTEE